MARNALHLDDWHCVLVPFPKQNDLDGLKFVPLCQCAKRTRSMLRIAVENEILIMAVPPIDSM